jgi:hypothetical protein
LACIFSSASFHGCSPAATFAFINSSSARLLKIPGCSNPCADNEISDERISHVIAIRIFIGTRIVFPATGVRNLVAKYF